jgi:hypothetical protein
MNTTMLLFRSTKPQKRLEDLCIERIAQIPDRCLAKATDDMMEEIPPLLCHKMLLSIVSRGTLTVEVVKLLLRKPNLDTNTLDFLLALDLGAGVSVTPSRR